MAHLSEDSRQLAITHFSIATEPDLLRCSEGFDGVLVIQLPAASPDQYTVPLQAASRLVSAVARSLGNHATLVVIGEVIDRVQVHAALADVAHYHHWITIRRKTPFIVGNVALPNGHFGALIYTRYPGSLRHTQTRIQYSYCPACDKTTKDYGGKKHTYHHAGTLISDVWRDFADDPDGDLQPTLIRLADLFGILDYVELRVLDFRALNLRRVGNNHWSPNPFPSSRGEGVRGTQRTTLEMESRLYNSDCLTALSTLPDNSVDFAFADPPYNLQKAYTGYTDDLDITGYFRWCDEWLSELARVLKPGRTCAILNIPLWSIRHFLYLQRVLAFQNWIAWDALAFPVRRIMPAHYAILCFSKGEPRPLPCLIGESGQSSAITAPPTFNALRPLADDFCLRAACVSKRRQQGTDDTAELTDLWGDIHRLKHNSRRVDHPCQLPPHLMYRLIAIFTRPGEVVLDCFNGAGTTTLAAHQLGRRYIGIEAAEKYHHIALARHEEIRQGLDPFRKQARTLGEKNSPVARLPRMKYAVSKKRLQLEVRRIAELLGRLPTRDEVAAHSAYPIDYYDSYFASWGEVCAAARTTGMSETRGHS